MMKSLTERSNTTYLYKLSYSIGLNNLFISSRDSLPSALNSNHIRFIILNLDHGSNGTHWVGLDKKTKMYFDSYAQPKPIGVPSWYKRASTKKELQSIDSSMCGQLVCLWMYYMKNKSNDEYYKLFKDCY